MNITFLGATGTVTGSKYLLTIGDKKILIDCGLFQGERTLRERNWAKLPVDPTHIDAVILTHAHLDHSGYLPLLVKNGFTGPIYATQSTKQLCGILLPDSGHIQEEDAYFANKHKLSRHNPALPLYTMDDAIRVMPQFKTIAYDEAFQPTPNCTVTFSRSAHILGSAFVRIQAEGKTIVFSGDLGRMHDPIMGQPTWIDSSDYLVIESTYGDRLHDPESPENQLAEIINTTSARGGTVVIPAFAVGRTQSILYYISQLKEKNRIPDLPIFLDSPMAESVTDIYARYLQEHCLDKEICIRLSGIAKNISTPEESQKLDSLRYPAVIISASGMATGGRVVHHIKAFAPGENNTILFAGYQAKETLGERIISGAKEVKIYGQIVPMRAEIKVLSNLSAHADAAEILEWLSHFKTVPQQTFITHGEPEPAQALKQKIEAQLHWNCLVPEYQQKVEL